MRPKPFATKGRIALLALSRANYLGGWAVILGAVMAHHFNEIGASELAGALAGGLLVLWLTRGAWKRAYLAMLESDYKTLFKHL